jgi:hypothetical protein
VLHSGKLRPNSQILDDALSLASGEHSSLFSGRVGKDFFFKSIDNVSSFSKLI